MNNRLHQYKRAIRIEIVYDRTFRNQTDTGTIKTKYFESLKLRREMIWFYINK